ncbi:hypothetical protein [Bradyrhizobium sp. dw_411]|uniref:hypothetical protein n=1 Tax=Bradyrhizobium sp. dw_411 TaxID=2720082 RepID=UPI001BCCEDE3|nr:hypothetical protein [Bradyrhizobium sp. dw_411]
MNNFVIGKAGRASSEPAADQPLDAAWMVLEAANDLGDHQTVEVCRRVIDASLNGRPASPFDLHIIVEYFS